MKTDKTKILRKTAFGITGILSEISPTLCSRVVYLGARKKMLHLKNPKTLNEKFMWLKLNIYNEHPLVKQCADKYAIRDYVREMGCEEILNPLFGVWEDPEDIDFVRLPQRFALKCNHGSGYNLICQDKKDFDAENARKTLKKWMESDFWKRSAELNYRGIPKRIICEKYIDGDGNDFPRDYKIMCFYGEPQYILCCDGRGEHTRYLNYSTDWTPLALNLPGHSGHIRCPETLDQMLTYAAKLSRPFPAVRMDFYEDDGHPVLGEMTFTPAGCVGIAMNSGGLAIYGERLELDTELTARMQAEALRARRERRGNEKN